MHQLQNIKLQWWCSHIHTKKFSVTLIPINTLRQQKDKETYSYHCVHNMHLYKSFHSVLPCEPSSLYHQLWLGQILQKGYSGAKKRSY